MRPAASALPAPDLLCLLSSRMTAPARLRDERDASDLLMSLFLTALFSYRRAEICSPFPDDFFKPDGEKDFETVAR